MDMQPVEKSGFIDAVGYDPADRVLVVRLKNGGAYQYHDVPPEAHHAMMKAESVGSHFCANIKNAYRHSKLSGVQV